MSWTAYGHQEGEQKLSFNGNESPEHLAQYDEATRAVSEIIRSGALGDPQARYNVSISGHGNPGHEPVPGWSNDHITISISQVERA